VRGERGHPIFAAVYDRLSRMAEHRGDMAERRGELLARSFGRVVEIGSGTGLNFSHYPRAVAQVMAVEPDRHMLRRSREAAARAPIPVHLEQASAEEIPVEDGWADFVVSTLVLCTVPDPADALAEVRRVLKPGGRLLFLEHVRADSPGLARWQDRLAKPWGFFGGGCHPNRDTDGAFREAGFELEELIRYAMPGVPIVRPHIAGVARKPR
jgi:ubiquinone/menaquinone biosynthesis C-methylase UbiE